ncbi:Outer membrane efflux protein [Singulisphaera sp. GP187]|uniref:TolC family protein n=1 Tax=Singulisphaera sp. GP187 TaxID=1882752 RepID=UPI00092C4983|nr:TolC family protein [Singulisphaera sp. GP187]SIN95558.1 Outer membrane efflux protein [Singulisphaera sp. GP187]
MPAQDEQRRGRRLRHVCLMATVGALLLMTIGCTRRYYRDFADRDTYRIVEDRLTDWRWDLPPRPVEASPKSRMGDVYDPNHEPIPYDDPGARPYQITAGRPFEFHGQKKRGWAPVENLNWMNGIPRDADGALVLSGPSAMQIALANSRDYQTNIEDVYLKALSLTLVRFTFFPQIFSSQTAQYRHFGANANDSNQFQLLAQDSLNWTFYSGAQLLVNFANNLVFEYNGKGFQTVNSGLAISLTQPLLQGAWARNFTQPLSLIERQTLYTIRNFASFRRQFYVDIVSSYLGLMATLQQVRNTQYQVDQLKHSLEEQEALVKAGLVDPLQRDTVAQNYQQSRSGLLGQEANYQTLLDTYRVTRLGLPADFPVKLDEVLLKKFELNDPRLDSLRKDNESLYLELLQHDGPPSQDIMVDAGKRLLDDFEELKEVALVVGKELEKWLARIKSQEGKVGTGPGPLEQDELASYQKEVELSEKLSQAYSLSRDAMIKSSEETQKFLDGVAKADPEEAWTKLRQGLVSGDFRARMTEQLVIQSQVRVYLIEVNKVDLTLEQAIAVALANRLDLMNSLAQVTDAWRLVEYDGNQLLAGLNIFYNGDLRSDPKSLGLVRFDAHDSQHIVGIRFNAPIVRRQQRNAYRADQIGYQRARRAYMLNHDTIVQQIRLDMRLLNLNRQQFEISRDALLIAARQVDQAEFNARTSQGASSGQGQTVGTLLVSAQQALVTNKNSLIGNWVSYEIARMTLFKDFDIMNIDAQGVWTNDSSVPAFNGGPVPTTPDPVGAPVETLLPAPETPASSLPPPPSAAASPFAAP